MFDVFSSPRTMSGGVHRAVVVATTPWKVTPRAEMELARLSAWFACPSVLRRDRSIAQILREEQAEAVIVADVQPTLYAVSERSQGLYVHPSLAQQRVERMLQGDPDRLVDALGIAPGHAVVDATLGLGVDTLVLATAAGPTGRVVAIESSWLLGRLFEYTLTYGAAWYPDWLDLIRRRAAPIEVRLGDHLDWFRRQPDNSVDSVYFDPMFRHAPKRSSTVDRFRDFAVNGSLSADAFAQAQRVARRRVVLKERPGFGQFERFQLTPDRLRARTAFGVWKKE